MLSGVLDSTGGSAERNLDAEYRDLTPSARVWSTTRPHAFYWAAAAACLVFTAVGVWMMTRSVIGGVLVVLLGLLTSAFTAWPGHWSERHPDEARRAVEIQRLRRNRLARRHPAYFLVLVPAIAGVDAALRFNRTRHHPSIVDWVVPAGGGVVFGLVLGIVLVRRARRSKQV